MQKSLTLGAIAGLALATVSTNALAQRDTIQVVGSSTVFPFSSIAAERFGQSSDFPAPVVESTGTGGGMQLFCGGVGTEHPDATGASRAMTENEWGTCQANGVTEVTELQLGYDGIVLANAVESPELNVTRAQLFQALAAEVVVDGEIVENPYTNWSEIDASLPDQPIMVFGPPPTSGTRDAWVELVMVEGCETFEEIAALEETDEDRFDEVCERMREDGLFIEAGENDNLIVQRLTAEPDAYGIFGFSFLDVNRDSLKGSLIENVPPTFENIQSFEYPVARPLFLYIKNAHRQVIPGLTEFASELVSDRAAGSEGYMVDVGLIPLSPEDRAAEQDEAANGTQFDRY